MHSSSSYPHVLIVLCPQGLPAKAREAGPHARPPSVAQRPPPPRNALVFCSPADTKWLRFSVATRLTSSGLPAEGQVPGEGVQCLRSAVCDGAAQGGVGCDGAGPTRGGTGQGGAPCRAARRQGGRELFAELLSRTRPLQPIRQGMHCRSALTAGLAEKGSSRGRLQAATAAAHPLGNKNPPTRNALC